MSRRTRFCVTLDVERDYAPEWRTPPTLTFTSVERALPELFAPMCREHGVRPTYLLSPETLCSRSATAALRALQQQKDCELGTHLHAEYVPPGPRPQQWCDHDVRIVQMQRDLDPDDERARLATLTELFVQQIGERPRAFRSGRFGASQHTGRFLRELGYVVDSSVTPLVVWKASDGTAAPDYRAMRHLPYRVHDDGDLCRHGHGPLLEIPVTVVAPSELGRIGNEPVWLRPWSSDRATMHAVLDAAARAEDEGKPWRTLCMMFHSMELVAGASPYPQTEADVARYLDDLRAVFSRARELGFAMQTLTEAALDLAREDDSTVRNAAVVVDASAWTAPDPKWQVFGSAFDPEPALVAHGAQPWFLYSCKQRHERWDNCLGYEWLAQNVRKDAPVLDLGCGPGFNLQWLARTGHTNLFGCDLDNKAIAAGSDIARATNTELHLWVDDAITSRAAPARRFAAIAAMNWIQLVPEFDLDAFLRRAKTLLTDDGALLLDYVDERYGEHAKSRWLTSDWNKPENERRASEYRTRFSPAILVDALRRHGFAVEQHWRIDGPVPRGVIASRRRPARKKQVLWVVDAPGWAHDRKAENLCRVLADRYDGRIVYQDALVESDLERADLVVLFYWRQLQSLDRLKPAFARLRHKLLLGICSHNELEGEFLNPGLALLRRLPRAVFTHSELLEREFRPRVGGPGYCLPNGVDTTFFSPAARTDGARRPLRIGWAGSVANFGGEMRGLPNVIQPAVAATPGVELRIAAREERLRTAAEMRAFYRGLDVYVCASRVEGTPNPCLEAAACGVPVVTTAVGNMPELVRDGENGFLLPRDAAAFTATFATLRDDRDRCARMGNSIRATVERDWDWQQRAEGFARMFDDALAAERGADVAAAHAARGERLLAEADTEAAMAAFYAALDADSACGIAHAQLATLWWDRGTKDAALTALGHQTAALQMAPGCTRTRAITADLLRRQGKLEAARALTAAR